MTIKLPKVARFESKNSIVVDKTATMATYINHLWCVNYDDLAGYTDNKLLSLYFYFISADKLFRMHEFINLKGYVHSAHFHMPHQFTSNEKYEKICEEIEKRPFLKCFFENMLVTVDLITKE